MKTVLAHTRSHRPAATKPSRRLCFHETSLRSVLLRPVSLHSVAISALLLGVTAPAHADLVGDFASAITVDTDWVTGANNATDVAFSNDGRALVTRKNGEVTIRRADGTVTQVVPFDNVDTDSEKGLLGVVADPSVENGFFFYVSDGPSNADKHRVYRGVLTADDELMIDEMPIVGATTGPGLEGPQNHDGGGLIVHNNYLYVAVGDTGSNATPPENKYGSCLNKPNGKILRVGLDGSVPADNPLVGAGQVTACDTPRGAWTMAEPDERVFAWGFRNPFRFWVDPETDLLWVGDVGETTREEISIGAGNQHFGYPFVEGDRDWGAEGALDGNADCSDIEPATGDCVPSVHAYDNPGFMAGGAAVTGGLIPEGCGWTNAMGGRSLYLFGDSSQDWIRALEVNADRSGVVSADAIDFGSYSNARPVSFRMGPDESLYIAFHGSGAVFRLTPNDQSGDDCSEDPTGMGGMSGEGGAGNEAGADNGGGGQPANGGSPGEGGSPAEGGTPGEAGSGQAGDTSGPQPEPTPEPGVNPSPSPEPVTPDPSGTDTPTGPEPGPAPTATGAAGSGNVDSNASDDEGGCGCRTVGHSGTNGTLGALSLLGLMLVLSRRRRLTHQSVSLRSTRS